MRCAAPMRRIRIYLPPPGPSANIGVQTPAASGTRHTRGNTNAASSEQLPAGGTPPAPARTASSASNPTSYELEAWDGYWKGWPQPEKARLGGIIYRVITENSSRGCARGEIDIAGSLSPEDLDQLESVGREDRPQGRHRHGRIRSEIQYAGQVHVRPEPAPRPGLRLRLRLLAEDLQRPRAADGHPSRRRSRAMCRARHAAPRHGQGPRIPGQVKWPQGGIELEYVYVQGLEEERQMGLLLIDNLKPLNITIRMVPLTWPNMVARGARPRPRPTSSRPSAPPCRSIRTRWPHVSQGFLGPVRHAFPGRPGTVLADRPRAHAAGLVRPPALYEEIQRRIVADQPRKAASSWNTSTCRGLEEERQMGLLLIDNLKPLNITIRMVPLTWPNMVARGARPRPRPTSSRPSAPPCRSIRTRWPVSQGFLGPVLRHAFPGRPGTVLADRPRAHAAGLVRPPALYEEIQRRIVADQPEIFGMIRDRHGHARLRAGIGGLAHPHGQRVRPVPAVHRPLDRHAPCCASSSNARPSC